jgi:16S rRNA (guanine966-N2)-methyltransferase
MRVIAGTWRGRRLVAPKGLETRPSASRLREAMFSALGDAIVGRRVVDLFAGSGALGIESLSRGALHVTFVERQRSALAVIERNLVTLGADAAAYRMLRLDAWEWLEGLDAGRDPDVDVVLADPPYDADAAARLLPRAAGWVQSGLLDTFALEHPAAAGVDVDDEALRVRTRRHGRGAFTIVEARLPRPRSGQTQERPA